MKKGKLPSLKRQLTILFLSVAVFFVASLIGAYMLHQSLEKQQGLLDNVTQLENTLINLSTHAHNFSEAPEDHRKYFAKQQKNFESAFQNILFTLEYQRYRPYAKDSLALHLSPESPEQAIMLMYNYEKWEIIKQNINHILYEDILVDSVLTEIREVQLYRRGERTKAIEKFHRNAMVLSPAAQQALANIQFLASHLSEELVHFQERHLENLGEATFRYKLINGVIILLNIALIAWVYWFLKRNILVPIQALSKQGERFLKTAKGDILPPKRNMEMGELFGLLSTLSSDIREARVFVDEITEGKLDASPHLPKQNRERPLGQSLHRMLTELSSLREQENKRNWNIKGQALLSEILHEKGDFNHLADKVISSLVQYVNGQQGGLFVVKDANGKETLDLVACTAYGRRKFLKRSFEMGEGLAGQAWQEGGTIHIQELPEEHSNIQSGLGQAKPTNLLVVPLINKGKIYGIIEIASLYLLEKHQIDFVEKVGENIASSLSAVEISNRTQTLLQASQELTKKLQEQEDSTLKKLQELESAKQIAQREAFIQEKQVVHISEKLQKKNEELLTTKQQLTKELEALKEQLQSQESENEALQISSEKLKENLQSQEDRISDLQESLRLKDLKIQKLRQKQE